MMLIEASCPSNKLAAVTKRILYPGSGSDRVPGLDRGGTLWLIATIFVVRLGQTF